MDQLSMPYRIGLAGLLVVALAWFVVLKPKDGGGGSSAPVRAAAPSSGPNAPGVKGLTRAIAKAHGAAATSDAANARVQSASADPASSATPAAAPTTVAAPATSKAVTPAARPAKHHARAGHHVTDLSAPLLRALHHGKTVVMVFYGDGSDDAFVRDAATHVGRHGGRVIVKAIPAAKVGRYAEITRGIQIDQNPTTLVIGADRKAREIIGLTDTPEIDQMVDDSL